MIDGRKPKPTPRRGRPRVVELSPEAAESLARRMLAANVGRDRISATMPAWKYAMEEDPALLEVLRSRSSKHSLPVAVREVARRVRGLARAARDPRAVRDIGIVTGGMRLSPDGSRLLAGEVFSIDDVTANTACCVPWPQGGDRCSDRFGVRVGRWQTLIAHCEGSSYVPLYMSCVRFEQTYRSEDAAAIINAIPRTVCRPDRLRLEGGAWQSQRVLAALQAMGIALESVKGRPNEKLVENYIHRFHTAMADEMRGRAQMGRYRGEERAWSELYCACRAGQTDPRQHFPMVGDLLDATDRAIAFLNSYPIESRYYGRWVPAERWQEDLERHPRPPVTAQDVPEWTTAPVLASRTVRRGSVSVAAAGPDGESLRHTFCAPELVEWTGQQVRVAFDPFCLDEGATIIEARHPRVICKATFTGATAGKAAVDAIAALRAGVRRELRVLLPNQPTRREILIRQPAAPSSAEAAPAMREASAPSQRTTARRGNLPTAAYEESEEELLARMAAAEADLRARGHYVPAPL